MTRKPPPQRSDASKGSNASQRALDLDTEILRSVAELQARGALSPDQAFAAWYAINLLDIDEDDAASAASLGGGEDAGIDLVHCDESNERLIVIQAHYPQNRDKATPKAKWDALVSALPCLENPDHFRKAGRPELASAIEEAQEQSSDYDTLAVLASFGGNSDQIRRALSTTERSASFKGTSFTYHCKSDIDKKYSALKAAGAAVPEDSVAFVGDRFFEDKGDYGRGYVGSVAAEELIRLYEKYDNRLFARNVRLFLGTRKGGINERIVRSAQEAPGRFWALNNGVTIVADTINRDEERKRFRLTRFSVVNGCQTTASLSKAAPNKGAKVLVRLVAASQDVVGEIVQYNNTQNAIRIWTVRAADTIQETIRGDLQPIGIVYAPKPQGARSSSTAKVIALDKVAQYLACQREDTLIPALREKTELFDRYYQSIFPHSTTASNVYLAWLIGTQAEELRASKLRELQEAKDLDQTLSGLLAITGTFWIVYTAFQLIGRHNAAPLRLQLSPMNAPEFAGALRKYVQKALELYIDIAINTYEPEYRSVRSALRSVPFLTKFTQKLKMRMGSLKLPKLEDVQKSIGHTKK